MSQNRTGVELLRYSVNLFDRCNETFNQRFSGSQLLRIAEACQKSKWDIFPDQWTERQVQECVQFGMTPEWQEKDGKVIPLYHNDAENVFRIAVSWTALAEVEVNAPTLKDALEWAEGDMPLPKESEYLDDSFQLDEDSIRDLNINAVIEEDL